LFFGCAVIGAIATRHREDLAAKWADLDDLIEVKEEMARPMKQETRG
jgi:hypothetical protein